MCKCFRISRSTYYYEASSKQDDLELETKIETIIHNNRDVYGSQKIKKELGEKSLSNLVQKNMSHYEKAWTRIFI